MKRNIVNGPAWAVLAAVVAGMAWTGTARAGIAGSVGSWLTGEAAALIISAVAVTAAALFGAAYRRIAGTFREAGEFLATLGAALEDSRITREEIADIVREGRDLFGVWR